MALSDTQVSELNIAQTRVNEGAGTETDIKNLEFAKTQGFEPIKPAPEQPTPAGPTAGPPTTPVKLDVESPIPETVFDQPAVTTTELSSRLFESQRQQEVATKAFLDETKLLNKQILEATKPTKEEIDLTADIKDLTRQSRELNLRAQAGVDEQGQRFAPMSVIIGAQEKIFQQANRTLQTLSAEQAPLIDRLDAVQAARESKVNQLQLVRQFMFENKELLDVDSKQRQQLQLTVFELEQQERQIKRQEQQEAKQFAFENNIASTMYEVGGIIYDTATGEARYRNVDGGFSTIDGSVTFTNPEQFFEHSGLTAFDQITKVKAPDELDEMLSVAEAKALGVKFGTTIRQAAEMGIVPVKSTSGSDISTIKLTNANKTILGGAGFSVEEISDIEKSFNDFGIEATLRGIDDAGKRLKVAEVYDAQDILAKIEDEEKILEDPSIIDPALRDQLEARGETEILADLETGVKPTPWWKFWE